MNKKASNSQAATVNSDTSNEFYNWKDGINTSLGINVDILLEENDKTKDIIKKDNNAGIMLSSLPKGYEWKVSNSDKSKLKLIASGPEKDNHRGEKELHEFFAFKALEVGKVTVKIKLVNKENKEVRETHVFEITIVE